MLLIKDNKIM